VRHLAPAAPSSHACWTLPGALARTCSHELTAAQPELNVNHPDSMLHITSKLGLSAESTTTLQARASTNHCIMIYKKIYICCTALA
jgi:hypothetical protein